MRILIEVEIEDGEAAYRVIETVERLKGVTYAVQFDPCSYLQRMKFFRDRVDQLVTEWEAADKAREEKQRR